MILETTIRGAIAPAETLTDKNILLQAIPDTVLNQLVTTTNQIPVDDVINENTETSNYDELVNTVVYTTVDSAQGPSPHSEVLGEVKDKLIDIVNSHINISKNIVKPVVEEMATNLETFIEGEKTKDPSSDFSIIVKTLPEVLKASILVDEIVKYEGVKPLPPSNNNLDIQDKSFNDIVKDIMTGSSNLDSLIASLLSNISEDEVVRIYRSFFTKMSIDDLLTTEQLSLMTSFDRASYMTVVYLLARKYLLEVQETVSPIDLINYKRAIVEIRDFAGSVIFTSMKQIERSINTKQILLRVEDKGKTAIMNGELYYTWLKNGGSPEHILGALVDGKTYATTKDLNDNIDTYKKVWNSYVIFKKTSDNNRLLRSFKEYVSNLFYILLKDKDDLEIEYINSHPNYNENVDKLLEEYVNNLCQKDIDNYNEVALTCIAKIRFYYTGSYKILVNIQKAYEANPDVDVRQAALLAVIDYVSDYVIDQVSIKPCH